VQALSRAAYLFADRDLERLDTVLLAITGLFAHQVRPGLEKAISNPSAVVIATARLAVYG